MAGNVVEYVGPPYQNFKENTTVHILGRECLGEDILCADSGLATSAWTANLLAIVPLLLAEPLTVVKFFWSNGTVAVGTNTDVGIYNFAGTTKLVSTGAVANSGSDAIQLANATATTILPANQRLWLVLGCDSSTHQYSLSNMVVAGLEMVGYKQQASGYSGGLPSSITPAVPTVAKLPMYGFSGVSVL